MHPVSLRRLRGRAQVGGAAALMPRRPGPRGPSKMTPEIEAECRALREQGFSTRTIAERMRGTVKISHVTVAALFSGERNEAKQQPLPLELEAAPRPVAVSRPPAPDARASRSVGAVACDGVCRGVHALCGAVALGPVGCVQSTGCRDRPGPAI